MKPITLQTTSHTPPGQPRQAVYTDMNQWYHPDIDYYDMINKLRQTRTRANLIERDYFSLFMWRYAGNFPGDPAHEQQMFQFWNKQFNDKLNKIINQITKDKNPRLILDVCAGDGTLAKLLTERGFTVKAVDNFSWPFKKRYFPVENMDYKAALGTYHPDVVIGCWMPLNSNWTPIFRKTKSVNHYLIIGEGEGGCCGGEWQENKGWTMRYHASPYALCRTDTLIIKNKSPLIKQSINPMSLLHSQVYTFSRL